MSDVGREIRNHTGTSRAMAMRAEQRKIDPMTQSAPRELPMHDGYFAHNLGKRAWSEASLRIAIDDALAAKSAESASPETPQFQHEQEGGPRPARVPHERADSEIEPDGKDHGSFGVDRQGGEGGQVGGRASVLAGSMQRGECDVRGENGEQHQAVAAGGGLVDAPSPETPRTTDEAVRATWSVKGMMPSPTGEWTPAHTMAAQPAADAAPLYSAEPLREAFEFYVRANWTDVTSRAFKRDGGDGYFDEVTHECWRTWEAAHDPMWRAPEFPNVAASPASPVAQADAQDSARLDWLLTHADYDGFGLMSITLPMIGDIRAAIDAAMKGAA